jgi:hypothetical protein
MRKATIAFIATIFTFLATANALDIKPDLIIDLGSRLGFSGSTLFYQVGSDVKTYDLSTKKFSSAECNLTAGEIYTSWIYPFDEDNYLIYRMKNAGPNEYRIYNKSGSCWSLHSGDSNTVNFYIQDPKTGNLVVGLNGAIKILDIKTGKTLQDNIGTIPAREVGQSAIIDDKLVLFASYPGKDDYTIRSYDLKNKTVLSDFSSNHYYSLLKNFDSKLVTKDMLGNVYYLDPDNIESSLKKIQFSLAKNCARETFYSEDKVIICEANGYYEWVTYSLQYLGSSDVTFPYGQLLAKFGSYSEALKSSFMYGNDQNFHFFNTSINIHSTVESQGRVNSLQALDSGRLFYTNFDREVYEFDIAGKIKKLHSFVGFSDANWSNDSIHFNKTNGILSYEALDYKINKLAVFGIKLE